MSRAKIARAGCLLALAAVGPALSGCGDHYTVTRVVDGRAQEGRFIEPGAYASYLRGAIAEGHGDYKTALGEYQNAARADDADPEIWTRIADVRCKINPKDMEARYAITRALLRDEEYGPAWVVRASCEIARGVDRVEVEQAAARAAEVDPRSARAQILLARVEDSRAYFVARNRLIGLTIASGDDSDAWLALASWGEGHGQPDLELAGFSRVAVLSPTKWNLVADAAVRLAGDGALREARSLSASLADSERRLSRADARQSFSIAHAPLVARLAVDEALAREDAEAAEGRASLGRVDVDEVAARAALLGKDSLARDLLAPVLRADPAHATAPRILSPSLSGDSLVGDAAAKLAAEGKLDRAGLSPEAAVDADVRSGRAPQPLVHGDARHRLLACAFASNSREIQPDCEALAGHVAFFGARDILVGVALGKLHLRTGRVRAGEDKKLLALGPTDPLVVGMAHELASVHP